MESIIGNVCCKNISLECTARKTIDFTTDRFEDHSSHQGADLTPSKF